MDVEYKEVMVRLSHGGKKKIRFVRWDAAGEVLDALFQKLELRSKQYFNFYIKEALDTEEKTWKFGLGILRQKETVTWRGPEPARRWLDPQWPLDVQCGAALENGSELALGMAFMPERPEELANDFAALDLAYHQVRLQFLDGHLDVVDDDAVFLVALQAYIAHGTMAWVETAKKKAFWAEYLPEHIAPTKAFYGNIATLPINISDLDTEEAKSKFLDTARSSKGYGTQYFSAREDLKGSGIAAKFMLGISRYGVGFHQEKGELEYFIHHTEIGAWNLDPGEERSDSEGSDSKEASAAQTTTVTVDVDSLNFRRVDLQLKREESYDEVIQTENSLGQLFGQSAPNMPILAAATFAEAVEHAMEPVVRTGSSGQHHHPGTRIDNLPLNAMSFRVSTEGGMDDAFDVLMTICHRDALLRSNQTNVEYTEIITVMNDLGSSTKMAITSKTTRDQMFIRYVSKLNIKFTDEWTFFEICDVSSGNNRWLKRYIPVLDQMIHKGTPLMVKVRCWVVTFDSLHDPLAIEFYYSAVQKQVVQGFIRVKADAGILLAALQLRIAEASMLSDTTSRAKQKKIKTKAPIALNRLEDFIAPCLWRNPDVHADHFNVQPRSYWQKKILELWRSDRVQMLSTREAMRRYIRLCHAMPMFGFSYYDGLDHITGERIRIGVSKTTVAAFLRSDMKTLWTARIGAWRNNWKCNFGTLQMNLQERSQDPIFTTDYGCLQSLDAVRLVAFYNALMRNASKQQRDGLSELVVARNMLLERKDVYEQWREDQPVVRSRSVPFDDYAPSRLSSNRAVLSMAVIVGLCAGTLGMPAVRGDYTKNDACLDASLSALSELARDSDGSSYSDD